MNKKKLLSLLLCVLLFGGVFAGAFVYQDRHSRFSFSEKNSFAMGTVISQKVYSPKGEAYLKDVTEIIIGLENIISRKKEGTVLSLLNEKGGTENSTLSEVIAACNLLSEKTDGAFDVTLGKITDLWAIGEDNEAVPEKAEIEKLLNDSGYKKLAVQGDGIKKQGDYLIDLGAVGKGLACDRAVAYYKTAPDCSGAIVAVGGSVGCFGKYNKAGDAWKIAVRHPRQENAFIGVISLSEGFVSTSGDYEKYFIENDIRYHHILDARTGYPVSNGLCGVTVVCDSGFLSDALSTICFILGEEESKVILEEYEASALFVYEDLTVSSVGEIDFEKS